MNAQAIKVALVEDSPDEREALFFLLRGSPGFACVGAFSTGEAALDRLSALAPDVVSATESYYRKTASLKFRFLRWFFFGSSGQMSSSFFNSGHLAHARTADQERGWCGIVAARVARGDSGFHARF